MRRGEGSGQEFIAALISPAPPDVTLLQEAHWAGTDLYFRGGCACSRELDGYGLIYPPGRSLQLT